MVFGVRLAPIFKNYFSNVKSLESIEILYYLSNYTSERTILRVIELVYEEPAVP